MPRIVLAAVVGMLAVIARPARSQSSWMPAPQYARALPETADSAMITISFLTEDLSDRFNAALKDARPSDLPFSLDSLIRLETVRRRKAAYLLNEFDAITPLAPLGRVHDRVLLNVESAIAHADSLAMAAESCERFMGGAGDAGTGSSTRAACVASFLAQSTALLDAPGSYLTVRAAVEQPLREQGAELPAPHITPLTASTHGG